MKLRLVTLPARSAAWRVTVLAPLASAGSKHLNAQLVYRKLFVSKMAPVM